MRHRYCFREGPPRQPAALAQRGDVDVIQAWLRWCCRSVAEDKNHLCFQWQQKGNPSREFN